MLWMLLSLLESEEDRRTLFTLYQQYGQAMLRAARGFFPGDPQAAEDAAQNAWIKVIQNFSKLSEIPCKNRYAWLVTIVKNEALTQLRRRRDTVPFEDWAAEAEAEPDGTLALEGIAALIQTMPETYRRVLELRLLEERDNREIALLLDITPGAAAARFSRGLVLLREKMVKEGYGP